MPLLTLGLLTHVVNTLSAIPVLGMSDTGPNWPRLGMQLSLRQDTIRKAHR